MEKLVFEEKTPMRLDQYIRSRFPALSSGILHKYLRQNKIKLNGKKAPLSTLLSRGDEVRLYLPPEATRPPSLSVLFEDENLLAIDKPPGISSGSNDEPDGARSILAGARRHLVDNVPERGEPGFRPALCHRLDTGTSGVLLVAKNPQTLAWMEKLMRERRIEKKYLCITIGTPRPPSGTMGGYHIKDDKQGRVTICSRPRPGAKPVETNYTTLSSSGGLALVEAELVTGRTHQIRAHFAFAGTPILGDSKYGITDINRKLRCRYQCLCAREVRFPETADPDFACYSGLEIHSDPPWYLQAFVEGRLELEAD